MTPESLELKIFNFDSKNSRAIAQESQILGRSPSNLKFYGHGPRIEYKIFNFDSKKFYGDSSRISNSSAMALESLELKIFNFDSKKF